MNLKLVGNPRLLAEVTNHPEIIHLKLINPTKVKFQTRSTRRDSCGGGEVLVNVSVSPKRHHDHRNFYKWKHLTGVATLQFQRFGPLSWRSPWWLGTEHNAGRHGAGKVAGSCTSRSQQEVKWVSHWGKLERRGPQRPPLQWHTSSNEALLASTIPYLLIAPLPWGPFPFKSPQGHKNENAILLGKSPLWDFKYLKNI